MPDASGRIKGIAVPALPWLCGVEYRTLQAGEYVERVKLRTCVLPRDHDGAHAETGQPRS